MRDFISANNSIIPEQKKTVLKILQNSVPLNLLANDYQNYHGREIACHLSIQDEYRKSIMYGKSLDFQINQLYQNLFSRKVDFAILSYWLRSIKSGSNEISDLACDLIGSLSNSSQSNNEQQVIDKKASAYIQ